MEKKINSFRVMMSLFKLGAIGFGGGAALLPLIERELVENKQWMDKKKFDVAIAVSSISPGSIPVALCAIWDNRYSIVSAFAYALPGSLIYLILLTGFSYIGESGTQYLKFTSVGLIAFVLYILFRFIKKSLLSGINAGIKFKYLSIMIVAFLLTNGNVLHKLNHKLFGISLHTPLFSINMLTLMLTTFFVIVFIGKSESKIKLSFAVFLAGLYALANGKAGILQQWTFVLQITMAVLATGSILYDYTICKDARRENNPFHFDFKPIWNLLLFILIGVAFIAITYSVLRDDNVKVYAGKVVSSTLTAFGGGEVFIGISEAVFVKTGFTPEKIFSSQIIGIANTMPGPVLMAIVTGIGYTYGYEHHGIAYGWLVGLLGLSLSIVVSAVCGIILYVFFDMLRNCYRLQTIIKYIMPVVCGMLISTALSLINQASNVLMEVGANPFVSIAIVIAIFVAMRVLYKTFGCKDLSLVLIGGFGTLLVLSIVA